MIKNHEGRDAIEMAKHLTVTEYAQKGDTTPINTYKTSEKFSKIFEAYINASKSQRLSFLAPCSDAMSATLKQISLTFRDFRITDLKISGDDKTQDWRFNLKGQSRKIPFTFKVSKRKGEFKILNAVINNVNLV